PAYAHVMYFRFFFNATARTEIYTLSLHDALPIFWGPVAMYLGLTGHWGKAALLAIWGAVIVSTIDNILYPVLVDGADDDCSPDRSEEHTSELQSRGHLVCRLLLEKKKILYFSIKT